MLGFRRSISRSVPARFSDLRFAMGVSVPCSTAFGASLLLSAGKASTSCSGRFFCRRPLMSRAAYLPFPLFPLRGTVRAFDHRFRLGLAVAPPFGIGVPQYPRRLHDLLCPLLTSAARSR